MKSWIALLVLIILGAVPLVRQAAQSQPLTVVQGQLKDQAGAPLAYQPVVIEGVGSLTWQFWRSKDTVRVNALTDNKGVFQIIDLPPGMYTVKALRPGSSPIQLGQFETHYGYQKLDVSDKLRVIQRDNPSLGEKYRLPAPSGVYPQPESSITR